MVKLYKLINKTVYVLLALRGYFNQSTINILKKTVGYNLRIIHNIFKKKEQKIAKILHIFNLYK